MRGLMLMLVGIAATTVTDPVTHAALFQSLASLRGRVDIRTIARPAARRPDVSSHGMLRGGAAPDPRRAVVYLENAPATPVSPRAGVTLAIDQRNETFVPHVLAVTAGTEVEFPNSDATYHNVFSLSRAKRFDLGRYASGRSRKIRLEQTGVVRVFCDIHSHMNAFILVFAHPFFAVTDADGRFAIDAVPPGDYRVAAWYDGEVRAVEPTALAAGRVSELRIALP